MSDANENGEEPQWRRVLRISAFAIGLIAIAAGPVFHYFQPDPHVGWASMIAGLIFMVSSRFDDVVEIGFASFRTRLERRVKKVEDTMEAVRRLAKASTHSALNSVQYAGRMGGFTETEKIQFLGDTRRLLSDLGIKDDEIAKIESDWHKAIEFDYASWATGLSQVPKDLAEKLHSKWKGLRQGGIEHRATPEEIRAFCTDADMLTPEREEILKDYEHYVTTRRHRREAVWQRHRE